jgi:hypothetical protein
MESRLAKAFKTEGSYGLFQRYLHRSILWQRSTVSGDEMKRMEYPPDYSLDRKVPSWSWMAYKEGGITYLDIPICGVKWNDDVKMFPSERKLRGPVADFSGCTIRQQNADCDIIAEEFDGADKRGWLKFDRENITKIKDLRCIVIGVGPEGRDCYVLVIQRLGGDFRYERVGVGTIQRRHILFKRKWGVWRELAQII